MGVYGDIIILYPKPKATFYRLKGAYRGLGGPAQGLRIKVLGLGYRAAQTCKVANFWAISPKTTTFPHVFTSGPPST